MISKDERNLRHICRNYHLVENYMQARFDKENRWHLHHRIETDEMKSRQQLIDEGKYYDVNPEELIFLTKSEHTKLHNNNQLAETKEKLSFKRSEETKKKISASKMGANNPMYGKPGTMLGKTLSEEAKKKLSEAHMSEKNGAFGKHWWNNGKEQILSKECPGEDFEKGMLKQNKRPRKSFK